MNKSRWRARRSYIAFKRKLHEWEQKDYHIETYAKNLKFSEYERLFQNAQKMGKKNIAREFAAGARSWTKSEIKSIEKRLPDDIGINIKRARSIYSRKELFNLLVDEGYSYEEAEYIVDS